MTYKQFNKYFNDEFKNKITKKVFDAKFGKDIKEDDLL